MAAYPAIVTYPPLRQLSVVPGNEEEICFTLSIKWSTARPKFSFQIHLCHDIAGSTRHPSLWPSQALTETDLKAVALREDIELHAATFLGTLHRSYDLIQQTPHRSFTFKYRVADDAVWQWFTGPSGLQQGEILFQSTAPHESELDNFVELQPEWNSEKLSSSDPGVSLFLIESAHVIGAIDPNQGLKEEALGLVKEQARYMALTRLEPPWMGPRHGDGYFYLSEDAMTASFLRKDGLVVTIAAPSVRNVYTVLRSNEDGEVVVASRDDAVAGEHHRVLLSISSCIESSMGAIMHHLREQVNNSQLVKDIVVPEAGIDNVSTNTWLDGLAFCTWNALGQDLTEQKVLNALQDLKDSSIHISTLLIDDCWQSVGPTLLDFSDPSFRGFASFEAASKTFPSGLDGIIKQARESNPQIQDIGVWHGLLGYWGALAHKGWIVDNYETVDAEGKMYYAEPTILKSVSAKDLPRFYNDFYTYLAKCGVTFVKTDVQSIVNTLKHSEDRAALIPAYQSAWTSAYLKHMGGKAISCMSQIPEMLWRILLQTATPPVVLRNSDDFFPEIPSSHPWHLWANAHNSLFTQHLNAVLDWDMFQTDHEYSSYHAAARCLSGGPILITDTPRKHDVGLIDQMVAMGLQGRSVALRPATGKTPRAFDRYHESGLLRIVTEAGAERGGKIMGVFNTNDTVLSALTSIAEFANIGKQKISTGRDILLWSHQQQKIRGPIAYKHESSHQSDPSELINFELQVRGFDIFTAYEAQTVKVGDKNLDVCVLGLLGKMTGAAAVLNSEANSSDGNTVSIKTTLKALGTLGVWVKSSSRTVGKVLANIASEEAIEVPTDSDQGSLLKIDLLSLWSRKERDASKETAVTVEVTVSIS